MGYGYLRLSICLFIYGYLYLSLHLFIFISIHLSLSLPHGFDSISIIRNSAKVKLTPTRTIEGKSVLAPRVAAFSSRGPSRLFPGIIKVRDLISLPAFFPDWTGLRFYSITLHELIILNLLTSRRSRTSLHQESPFWLPWAIRTPS